MSRMRALADPDHLPWLEDLRAKPAKEFGALLVVGLALGSVIAAAAISLWLGQRAANVAPPPAMVVELPRKPVRRPAVDPGHAPATPARVPVPDAPMASAPAVEPARAAPQPMVAAPPIVRPAPAPLVRHQRVPLMRRIARYPAGAAPARRGTAASATDRPAALPPAARGSYWPQPATAARLGRVIRLSRYSSREDAQLGWQSLQQAYPQLVGLPNVTVANRDARGRLFYRLHIVTTAQAQSEWLCNRLQRDLRHCTVLDTTD